MYKRIVGETIFETLIVIMTIVVAITAVMMTNKIREVFQSFDANQYDQLVDSLQMQQADGDEKGFEASLCTMTSILEKAEENMMNKCEEDDDTRIHSVFQKYYDTIEKGKQKEFSDEIEMQRWLKKQNFTNRNRVRSLITGYSKAEAIIMESLLLIILSLFIGAFIYRKKLLYD